MRYAVSSSQILLTFSSRWSPPLAVSSHFIERKTLSSRNSLQYDSPAAKNSKEAGSDYLSPFSPLANWRSDFFREEKAKRQQMAIEVDGEQPIIILDDADNDGKGKKGKSSIMCEGNSRHGAPCTT